jgi:PTH1 family peptidyl-tRNA hydrolase
MKLIVGLGNPGRKYQGTRHNVGYDVISVLHGRQGAPRPTARFNSEIAEIRIGPERVLLQSPLTYMNLSGQAVRALTDFHKLPTEDLLVVCDDFHLPLGQLRARRSGSAGGQRGLANIIDHFHSQDFPRLRIGIGQPPDGRDPSDWVLQRFLPDERPCIDVAIQRAADAATVWVLEGMDRCMTLFNTSVASEKKANDSPGRAAPDDVA